MTQGRILIVDDDASMGEMLELDLRRRGLEGRWCTSAQEALELLRAAPYDAVLTDLRMPDMDGIELCSRLTRSWPQVPVVVMTAFGSLETAIDAIRAGAYDFVTKPVELDLLAVVLERALDHHSLTDKVVRLDAEVQRLRPHLPELVGESDAMRRVLDRLLQIADSESTVLVLGETGTGKELAARALHRNSRRRDGPFIGVNCAALPETLQESELFGHVRGAFTDARNAHHGLFEQADGGTLFLDEIGEFTQPTQAKLLRVLEERTVRPVGGERDIPFDVRLVAATNRDLQTAVDAGTFRPDLLYRIDVLRLELPALRDRGSDCLLLGRHFMEEFASRLGKEIVGITEPVAEILLGYPWPGNVRELRNAIEAAVAVTRTNRLVAEDLPGRVRRSSASAVTRSTTDHGEILPLAEVERRHILNTLQALGGNKTLAAQALGLDRKTLYRKLQRWESATGE